MSAEKKTARPKSVYRHEWKHEISRADLIAIRQRLRAVATPDPHAGDGKYYIRSLYFDNLYDKALREKIDGVNRREKFRIRYYNGDLSYMTLEKKSKINGLGTKFQARLTASEAQSILDGDIGWMAEASDRPLVQELYSKMRSQGLRPFSCTDFLNPDCPTIPAGDPVILLEVKWDNFLPDIIRDAVQTPGRRVTAFSKYARARIYD